MDKKRVYTFGNGQAEGKAGMRNLLGGKGANLAEMNLIGVPVPPGFTITTEVCTEYYEMGQEKVVALLKQKKVPRIFARAIDAVHKAVLEAFDLERILTPEEDAARSLVQLLDFGTNMEGFRIDQDYYVVKFTVPEKFVGYFVNELNLDEEFHLKMIGLKRANKIINSLGISLTELHVKNELPGNEKVEEGDELVCYGRYRDFQAFWKAI